MMNQPSYGDMSGWKRLLVGLAATMVSLSSIAQIAIESVSGSVRARTDRN